MLDTIEKIEKLINRVEETSKLHDQVDELNKELLRLAHENYKLLCHGILKLYWYAVQGDTENFNNLFETLVKIAMEGTENEKDMEV
jgi:hypothetical protein